MIAWATNCLWRALGAVNANTDPSADIAPGLRLGLSRDLMATLNSANLADASAWVIEAQSFRAYSGPFSALESLQAHARESGGQSVRRRGGAFQVSLGNHSHCASPPVPAPMGFEEHRRVSVHPAESSIDSCLSWFTVDLFVDQDGQVAAVTLDVWEP